MASSPTRTERAAVSGLWFMVGAAFFWSVMTLFVKVLGQRLPTQQIVFVKSAVMLIASGPLIRSTDGASLFVSDEDVSSGRTFLWIRGIFGFISMSCFYFALTKLPLADATVFHYTNPIWTALIAALVLSETLKPTELMGVLLSLIGVAFIAQPTFLFGDTAGNLNLVYVGIGLLGAILAGAAYVAVRRLRAQRHPLVIIYYFALVSTLGSAPLAVMSGITWPTPWEWAYLIGGVGGLSLIAQLFLTNGLHRIKAGRAMAVSYLQIVFAAAWGVLFFSEVPDLLSVTGAVLVIGGTALSAKS